MNTHQNNAKLVKNHLNQLISGDPGPAGTRARRGPGPGGDPGPAGTRVPAGGVITQYQV